MWASEGRLAARSPISTSSSLFTLPMQLHQMQPSLKSRYDRHSRGWNFFVSTPVYTFPPHPFTLPLAMHLLPLHPPQMALVGLPLWIEERGLTKVSMVTVHSVNHAAADVSSPSLFPFSSLHCCQPYRQPLLFFLLYFCVRSLHLTLTFQCNFKPPLPMMDIISFVSLFTTTTQSQSSFITLLISQDRQERGEVGWGRHNVHLTFNQRLSQHAAPEQTGWSWSMCVLVGQRYEQKLRRSCGRILQYLQHP